MIMLTTEMNKLSAVEIYTIAEKVREPFLAAVHDMMIESNLEQALLDIYIPLAACLAEQHDKHRATRIVGINGAQGSGKSTLCRLLKIVLEEGFDKQVATFSIDDIYLTREEREKLAKKVHPLLETRGVPGTHDVFMGLALLRNLRFLTKGQSLALPVFDKANDDRASENDFRQVTGPINIVLFEGWCVGAIPQRDESLAVAVNSLERQEDPKRTWRKYVNKQLREGYKELFSELDFLIMLKIPGMASVMEWRSKQERKLAKTAGKTGRRVMDTTALQRFIMHYERLTRATLTEMPDRADLVFTLNKEHQIDGLQINNKS
jgi:D-glycerate 3-kinase